MKVEDILDIQEFENIAVIDVLGGFSSAPFVCPIWLTKEAEYGALFSPGHHGCLDPK